MFTALRRLIPTRAVCSRTTSHRFFSPGAGVVHCPSSTRGYLQQCHLHQGRHRALSSSFSIFDSFAIDEMDDETSQDDEKQRLAEKKRETLRQKKGRGWTDPWDLDDTFESNVDFDSLPEWAPELVSRISQERVQIYRKPIVDDDDDDAVSKTIPTLADLAVLPLPPPAPPHPGVGQTKAYALFRKRAQYKFLLSRVTALAEPKIKSILALTDWQDKQDAVDVLFEEIEFCLKRQEEVLGKHPSFGRWVERALEEYLRNVQKVPAGIDTTASGDVDLKVADETAVPIFMDCYNAAKDSEETAVPSILIPLKSNARGQSVGRMVEEWELSAHSTSKRIMLRQSTRHIARAMVADETKPPRIFVHGRQGVGKTAAIAAVVASARCSGAIVLYLPEGDQMHQNGFYVEPNERREGVFDLPVLQQGVCENMIDAHKDDLESLVADATTMEAFFTNEQIELFKGYDKSGSISLAALLSYGAEKVDFAPMCYSAAVDVLMKQDQKPFVMVMDEFNCFFQPGQFYHQDFDDEVKLPIPYHKISLFQPILDAMAVAPDDVHDDPILRTPVMMKRGAVIVGTTESHAVARKITGALTVNAKTTSSDDAPLHVIEVPRLSALEVEHMIANYEATGVGSLRLDRGATVMNGQEVTYLRMVSGGEAQNLMNACMM